MQYGGKAVPCGIAKGVVTVFVGIVAAFIDCFYAAHDLFELVKIRSCTRAEARSSSATGML